MAESSSSRSVIEIIVGITIPATTVEQGIKILPGKFQPTALVQLR